MPKAWLELGTCRRAVWSRAAATSRLTISKGTSPYLKELVLSILLWQTYGEGVTSV